MLDWVVGATNYNLLAVCSSMVLKSTNVGLIYTMIEYYGECLTCYLFVNRMARHDISLAQRVVFASMHNYLYSTI